MGAINWKDAFITQNFKEPSLKRHHWTKDDGFILSRQALKSVNQKSPIVKKYNELVEKIKNYPEDSDAFGLIHGDLHHGNFHYDFEKKKMTAFDFDDCNYFYYAFDIAVPFASLEFSNQEKRLNLNLDDALNDFFDGYHKEYELGQFWIDEIQTFKKYRYASLYFWCKGRELNNRIEISDARRNFVSLCEKLALD